MHVLLVNCRLEGVAVDGSHLACSSDERVHHRFLFLGAKIILFFKNRKDLNVFISLAASGG